MSQSSFIGENGGRSVRIRGTKFVEPCSAHAEAGRCAADWISNNLPCGDSGPFVIEHLSEVEEKVRAKIKRDLPQFEAEKAYKILFRHYGAGEIMKERDPETWTPKEIGLVIEVLSQEQETADTVCALARSAILHMGFVGRRANSGNLAFCTHRPNFPLRHVTSSPSTI